MKDLKIILAGLIALLLIVFIGAFLWLLKNNGKNIDPLPITVNKNAQTESSIDVHDSISTQVLYLQAEEQLQVALDDVIIKFEARYPRVQVLARYVPKDALLTLSDPNRSTNTISPATSNIDIIIANDTLSQAQLAPLQAVLDNNNETRNLTSFNYAIKDAESVDGVILTDNPVALTFRNFILSSVGQDILQRYDYDNIDGYKNSMDDLFNPSSRAKSDDSSVKIADALSNGE